MKNYVICYCPHYKKPAVVLAGYIKASKKQIMCVENELFSTKTTLRPDEHLENDDFGTYPKKLFLLKNANVIWKTNRDLYCTEYGFIATDIAQTEAVLFYKHQAHDPEMIEYQVARYHPTFAYHQRLKVYVGFKNDVFFRDKSKLKAKLVEELI